MPAQRRTAQLSAVPDLDPAAAILACVAAIPPGSVMTYGDVAEYCGLRSARQVGRALARAEPDASVSDGSLEVPWWRVLRADGTLPEHLFTEQRQRLLAEGVRFRDDRVDLPRHRWDGR
jgi:alkylated DNA nucleotide flippase Atl1